MNTILKRVISLVLCFVLVAGYVPTGAFAEETGETVATVTTEAATEPTGEAAEETEAGAAEETEPDNSAKSKESGMETVPATEPSTELTEPAAEGTMYSAEAQEPEVIAVTGITLDKAAVEVGVGELPMTLVATVLPEDATDKTVTWTSSEPGVASVEDGVLTFGYMGEAVITATAGEYSATCTVTVGESEWSDYAAEEFKGSLVIAASDFQHKNGNESSAETVSSILTKISESYGGATGTFGFLFGGDYSYSSLYADGTTSGQAALDAAVDSIYSDMDQQIYIQGNHDPDDTVGDPLSTSGAHDTDAYGVYVINEKDYPWGYYHSSDMQSITKATAEALDSYLDAKVTEEYSKPVFVLSHLPLHYSVRTKNEGDGMYAKYLYDVLDEAGDAGLNVIFLYGHNHSSSGYDDYLGGSAVYLPVKSSITIAKEGSGTEYYTDTLSFTYMNYGYVGYYGSSAADDTLTMTVFEITDEQVTVRRFADDEEHLLKAKGVANSGSPAADTSTVDSGAIIELGEPEEQVTVENTDKTITVTSPGLTGLEVEKKSGTADNTDETYSAYASYDITPEGYTAGKTATVTITLDEADGFDASRNVVVMDATGANEDYETSIVDGKVTFQTTHFSTYNIGQRAVTTDAGGSTSGTVYTLDTDGIDAGAEYLIVSAGSDSGTALTVSDGASVGTSVTITNNQITLDNTNAVWVLSGSESGTAYNEATGYYVYPSSTSGEDPVIRDETCKLIFESQGNGAYTIQRDSSYSAYYVSSSSDWGYSESETTVYLFKKGTSGSTVTPEGGDWVTIDDGKGKAIYQLATNGVTAGKEYLIVNTGTDSEGYALTNSDGSVATTKVAISGSEIRVDDTNLAWTFTANSSSYNINNGETYIHPTRNGGLLGSSENVTVAHEGSGKYTITRGSSYSSTTYYVAYSDSTFTSLENTESSIYLYEKTGTETTTAEYAKLDGNLEYTVSRGASAEEALAAVMAGINVIVSSDKTTETTLEDSNENITWELASNYDGTVPGEYAVTIYYKDKHLGTAKVIVPEVTLNGISVAPSSGVVTVGASEAALVGATITVDVADTDGDDFTVPVTVGMLSGNFDTSVAGTYTGLTVTYGGKTYENFTLTVKEKVVNNYPSYPNEGAVKVDKSATGIDFQKTGVARVELTTSGVPMNQGVDVLLVLDTSSSMGMQGSLDSGTRIGVLQDCVDALIVALKADRADGSQSDIDIAVVDFAGYLLGHDGTKLDNYINEQVKETDEDKVGKVLTDGWVDVQSLSDTWGTDNISEKSGTNYDHGLEQAYNLLAQKQADNGDDTRKQFVLFMSDGAPLQYNGVNSNSLESDWEQWILGSYTANDVAAIDTIQNPEFYYGNNNGNGQKHWVAEAIKGAPENQYNIVYHENYTYGSATMGTKTVNGLGATMYSVGLALEATNMPTDVAGQKAILKTIATSEDVFYSVTSAAGLQEAFDDFAGAILYAAENAVFEDQMGPNFNIQLANTTKRLVDGEVFTLNPAPTIEVREYTIWTRAELEADGTFDEADAKLVGTRKTNTDGSYIYKTLEVVSFNADGTEAYTGDDTTNNIMDEKGVICANTFWYNTSTTNTVKVDVDGDGTAETDLKPETFIWKVGTIKTTELALSYYVYLDESLEGEASAGSYETNNYAILSYDNYLGNPCSKDTVSPQMAWLSANVSFAYYLVNKDGTPVNSNGEEVTFANREIIVHPTKYGEIKLNSIEGVENLTVASTGVLDDTNYKLFDYDAEYKLLVNSDATGGWEITVGTKTNTDGTTEDLPLTTYVTDFSDTLAFTNATSSTSKEDNYDYTHTTVWFAVVWEPDALDDTVVIDYGLPVDVHVMTNDFFGDFGELIGVASGEVTDSDNDISTNEIPASDSAIKGEFGTAKVIKPETGANESNSVIRYTLDSMEMPEPEVFTYSVEYTNTKLHTNNGFYYGKLTVIPATTIYYEDSFLTLSSYTKGEDGNFALDENSKWITEGTTVDDATQDEDRPGDINFAFDTIIDANNVYGNDSAYETMSTYSMGSARKITVDESTRGEATFTFYGTGFDVIGLTSNTTGTITVKVTNASGETVRSTIVDTYYGYTKNDAGEWEASNNVANALYQVPVMKIFELPYGQYTVKITAGYNDYFNHTATDGKYDLYLDSIRIYDPTGNENDTANDAYVEDGEGWPEYFEVRDQIIGKNTFDALTTDTVEGIVFIDGVDKEKDVAEYTSYGPNNETYLAKGQAISFDLNGTYTVPSGKKLAKIQMAIKTVGGSGKVEVYGVKDGVITTCLNETISTATDMYYDITALDGKTVVINSTGDAIISITNVKVTYAPAENTVAAASLEEDVTDAIALFTVSRASANAALATMNVVEEEIPETPAPDPSEPDEPVPEEPVSTRLQAAVDAAKQLQEKDYTPKSFKALKTALKSAEKVLNNKNATEEMLEAALEALNAAVAALEVRPDTSALQAAVDAAKKLKEKDYTSVSYKAVTTARKAAEKVLKDKNATQAQVDVALEALNAAVAALEAKADFTALKAAVNAAKKLKEKDYTLVSYKAVTAARKAAEKVMKDKNANQAAADAALEALNAAVSALEARANTAALKAAVNAAKKLKSKNYTAESFQALTTARKAAEKLMKDKNANQAMADEALAALNEAMDALVAKTSEN